MRILIIGAGNMGRGIATRVLTGGHAITLFDVDPAASEALVGDLGGIGMAATRRGTRWDFKITSVPSSERRG
jgi:3-hydroxyisobutyrate dehydrogenase-like beta-hydroxyacid dehydrogenase